MLTVDPLTQQPQPQNVSAARWQEQLKQAVRDPEQLGRILHLPEKMIQHIEAAAGGFPLFAPRPFLERIQPGNPEDPLLLQLLPRSEEQQLESGYSADPLKEHTFESAGLLQKYPGRVLLVTTGACAIHCRYCFRKDFPYEDVPHSIQQWQPALEAIQQDHSVREVILSGGDPLMLVDQELCQLHSRIQSMDHVRTIRIHTRLPIMIPSRVTADLQQWIRQSRLQVILVIHANHAAELDSDVAESLRKLQAAGALLLNQSVLLKDINDHVDVLADLSERLLELQVLPYYLHQLDPVRGTSHFHVPVERGKAIMAGLRSRLPGYAVPRYVQEQPGELSKTPLA